MIRCPKNEFGKPTSWSVKEIPPKISPYKNKRPAGKGFEWRAITAKNGDTIFHVLALANSKRGNYKAFLTLQEPQDRFMIARFETHPSHPGIHYHTWCKSQNIPACPNSIEAPFRIPKPENVSQHRSNVAFSPQSFWLAACNAFNVIFGPADQLRLL
ncbi:hypothetical protein A4R89_02105 [Acetobacter ascendens]|nr:hypothetical protein A4R89_02105 [Acetobacter ascendens]